MMKTIINEEKQIGITKINKFYSFHKNNKVFMLSNIGTSILLDEETYKQIVTGSIDDDLKIKLINLGFAEIKNGPIPFQDNEVLPTFILISMTNTCNLHCKYCFNKFVTKKFINNETIDKIVDYIKEYYYKYNLKNITIQPWGGEPLLCFDKIKYLKEKLDQTKIKYKISIETNATLITKEIAQELKNLKMEIGVSVDGEKQIHNLQRPFNSGKESFSYVIKGMDNLDKYYENTYGTINVVTKQSMLEVKSTLNLLKKHHVRSTKFNIVKIAPDSPMALSKEDVKHFANTLVDVFLDNPTEIIENNILDRLNNLIFRPCKNICLSKGCQGGRKMISFDMDGNIFPCEMTDYKEVCMGNISDHKDLIELISENIKSNIYFSPKEIETECNNCPYLYYCQGGCTSAILYSKNAIKGIDDIQCEFNKTIYARLIEIILDDEETAYKLMGIRN